MFGLPKTILEYELIRELGQGTFATVWLARHTITGTSVAIKVISKTKLRTPDSIVQFVREVNIMKQVDHPCVAQLFHVTEDRHHHYLIMEYAMNGDLLTYVNDNGNLSESTARRYLAQIVSVLEYLHNEKQIAHRDLKAENVLLDKHYNIRIVDFGLSNSFTDTHPMLNTACGSPAYVAPEMIRSQAYTKSTDIWSTGVLLFAIVAGWLPFENSNMQDLFKMILFSEPKYPSHFSPALVDLLKKMMTKSPENRATITQIKEHPWFSPFEYKTVEQFTKERYSHVGGEIPFDAAVAERMESFGMDTTTLKQSLFVGEIDSLTAAYKMLLKEKTTDDFRQAAVLKTPCLIPRTSTPPPSKLLGLVGMTNRLPAGHSLRKKREDEKTSPETKNTKTEQNAIPTAVPRVRIPTLMQRKPVPSVPVRPNCSTPH